MNAFRPLAPLVLSLASACASSADPQSEESDGPDAPGTNDAGNTWSSRTTEDSEIASANASSSSGGAADGSTSDTSGQPAAPASSDAGANTGTASSAGGSGGLDATGGAGGAAGTDDSDDGMSAAGAAGDNDDDDDDDDDDDGGNDGDGDGQIEPGRVEAMAITRARLEELREEEEDAGTGSVTGGGTSPDLDPKDLFLRFSDLGVMCTEAFRPLPCGLHWFVSIVLPPEYQAVGLYDLDDPAISIYSYRSETGEARSNPDDCSWGGGSLQGGTLEVLAIDEGEVRFQIELSSSIWDTNPDGEYTAVRCQ